MAVGDTLGPFESARRVAGKVSISRGALSFGGIFLTRADALANLASIEIDVRRGAGSIQDLAM